MRPSEFDFRLWLGEDYSSDNYKYQDLLTLSNGQKSEYLTRLGLNNFDNKYNIELYTGFKDKNGTKIYEGDIVGLYDADNDMYEKRKVVFENAGLVLKHKKAIYGNIPLINLYQTQHDFEFNIQGGNKELDNIDSKTLRDIKVIGNIHENAELLG